MNRRNFIVANSSLLAGISIADTRAVQSLDEALRWLDGLDKVASVKSDTAWKTGAVLEHLAQRIDMSLDGVPEPKSALFQNTVGAAAFAVFKWCGKMSHGLTDPIPGAPALAQPDDWKPGALRPRGTIARFNSHADPVKPHFAYGTLSRSDFALAHAMHIANHQDEVVVS